MAVTLRVTVAGREYAASVDGDVVRIEGVDDVFTVARRADGRWAVNGVGADAEVTPEGTWVTLAGCVARADVESAGTRTRARSADADALRPPMSATVIRVHVEVGARVAEGDKLVVLEAMKMEMPIRAPRAGVIKAVHCREGELVQPSSVLIDLE